MAELLMNARELAEIYLMARKRQKGCDGMGELAMVKEEFKDSLDTVLRYCNGKGYLSDDSQYDIDSMAEILAIIAVK